MEWIFVYGTLRSGETAAGLLDGFERVPATLADHALYGQGRPYPFAVSSPGSTVVGEAVAIPDDRVDDMLGTLGDYEGDEYRRVRASIVAGGRTVLAHLWVAVSDQDESERIPSGDWRRM